MRAGYNGDMGTYSTDSTGARIAWMRKQRKMTGGEMARLLGVRNVYISQIENNEPSRTEEAAPVYFSPEADAAAQLIDDAPPEERARILSVVRALVATFSQPAQEKAQEGSHLISQPRQTFAQRLIYGERDQQRRGELSR